MTYSPCPVCGASKHHLKACPSCGFTRRLQTASPSETDSPDEGMLEAAPEAHKAFPRITIKRRRKVATSL
jgi:hypothetical protein